MIISKPLAQTLTVGGRRLSLNLAFNRVLTVCDLWQDEELTNADKMAGTFDLLIRKGRERRWLALQDEETQGAAITSLFQDYIDTGPHRESKGPRAFDIKQDAEYLYAAFWQTYGIDLYSEQEKMDWRKFSALLTGLPKGTRLSEIIEIRTKPMPKPDKYNAEERKALSDAKAYFRLDNGKPQNVGDTLAELFGELQSMAKTK